MNDDVLEKEKIQEYIKNNDIKKLNLKNRIELLNNHKQYIEDSIYSQIKYNLFTKEESEEIYKEKNYSKKIEIIIHLEDEEKLQILNHGKLDIENQMLINSIKSDEYKSQALLMIINNPMISFVNYNKTILSFNNIELAIKTIRKNIDKIKNKMYLLKFDISIAKIYKATNNKNVLIEFLKMLDENNLIDEFFILNDFENKIEVFKEIIKLPNYKQNNKFLQILISKLNRQDSIEAYEELIKNGYNLKQIEIMEIFKLAEESQKEKLLYKICEQYDIEERQIKIAKLLSIYHKEEIPNQFEKYIINNEKYDSIKTAFYYKNETLFSCLEKILEKKMDDNQLNKTIQQIIKYFEELNYEIKIEKDIYSLLIKKISKAKNFEEKNLKDAIEIFGYEILKYLNQENMQKLLMLEENNFNKIAKLFDQKNITIDNHKLDSLTEAIIQREFMYKEKNIYNIFSELEKLINNKDEKLKNIFDKIIIEISKKRIDILKNICKKNKKTIEELYENIKKGKQKEILHELTNNYIAIKREEYSEQRKKTIKEELLLEKKYKKEWIIKKYLETNDDYEIIKNIESNCRKKTKEQHSLIIDREQLKKIITFKKNPSEQLKKEIDFKNLKIFNELLTILYENNNLEYRIKDDNAEYIYATKKIEKYQLLEILSQLEIECINEKLIPNEKAYNTLQEILYKYKFIGIGETFNKINSEIDLEISSQTIAGIINSFYLLYEEYENKKRLNKTFTETHTMTQLLEEGYVHEMTSNKYATIIGKEDFKLIFSNTGKNRTASTANKRLEKIIEIIPKIYEKKYLAIPPISEIITLSNEKKIKVEIGQTLDFTNLSVGERTQACLRVCGAFEDLWEFVLTNKFGFNIIFKEPTTNKFISRVSGVINGNTIFENELRNSEHPKYTDDDIIEANKITTKKIEEQTKNNKYKIENIIITSDNAMKKEIYKKQEINTDRKNAMFNLNFNYEPSDTFGAIVLSNNGNIKPIILGENKTDLYPIKMDIKTLYGQEAIEKVQQINAINDILKGENIENIEIKKIKNEDSKKISCITNNQFYILKMGNEIIEIFIIDKFKDDNNLIQIIEDIIKGEQNEKNRNYH